MLKSWNNIICGRLRIYIFDLQLRIDIILATGGALAVRREIGSVVRSLRERQLQFNKETLFKLQIICQFFNKNGKYSSPTIYHDKIFQVFNKNKINKFNKSMLNYTKLCNL